MRASTLFVLTLCVLVGLGVAIVSYNGDAYFGLTADPSIVPDVEEFTARLQEAAAECTALAATR